MRLCQNIDTYTDKVSWKYRLSSCTVRGACCVSSIGFGTQMCSHDEFLESALERPFPEGSEPSEKPFLCAGAQWHYVDLALKGPGSSTTCALSARFYAVVQEINILNVARSNICNMLLLVLRIFAIGCWMSLLVFVIFFSFDCFNNSVLFGWDLWVFSNGDHVDCSSPATRESFLRICITRISVHWY